MTTNFNSIQAHQVQKPFVTYRMASGSTSLAYMVWDAVRWRNKLKLYFYITVGIPTRRPNGVRVWK